jgi:hypothetical protein
MKIKDLPNWPPTFGTKGIPKVPTHLNQVTIKSVGPIRDKEVDVIGTFAAGETHFTVRVPDKKTAEKVAAIFNAHIGRTVLDVQDADIPD